MKENDFKSALRSYRWMERRIQSLFYRIAEKEHELTGQARHSIPLTVEQEKSSKPMPHGSHGRSLVDRICELDELKDEYQGLRSVKTSLDAILGRMQADDRAMVVAYYCDGARADALAERFGFAKRDGVYRRMKAAIKQSL